MKYKTIEMNMKRIVSIFAVLALSLGTMASAQQMPPIPVDPNVRIGQLENGLTYYIRHNEEPKGQANFYIAQKVGSILEDEPQRGLAHFLEHMCFNGTEHFPGNGVVKYCESSGWSKASQFLPSAVTPEAEAVPPVRSSFSPTRTR